MEKVPQSQNNGLVHKFVDQAVVLHFMFFHYNLIFCENKQQKIMALKNNPYYYRQKWKVRKKSILRL